MTAATDARWANLPPLPDRIASRTNRSAGPDACWPWMGVRDRKGYGHLGDRSVHRTVYALEVGPIPAGMTIDHLCFNPPCVNPAHLRLLTLSENSRRQRLRLATRCKNGHEFTPENTRMVYRGTRSRRYCRTCDIGWWRAYRARERAKRAAA